MARTDSPLGGEESELVGFAAGLRQLRERAGRPSYRELARQAHYSSTTLSDAATGRRLPTLPVVLAYVRACDGDPGEWERRWREIAAEPDGDGTPPYPGLAAFGVDDADRFFGRGALLADLTERLHQRPFLAVVGASGVGKSSLLQAGLAARLPGRVWVTTPGEHPLQRLSTRPPVLVIDQFEEVFTLCRDPDERAAFIRATVRRAQENARIVIGVRADFVAHCAEHPDLRAAMADAQVLVGPPGPDELRQVVVGPAERAGCTVESALVAAVVAEAAGRPAVLPLVSHALLETWRRRTGNVLTLAGYREAGGIAGALAKTADDVYASLSGEQRRRTRNLFLRLTAFGEGTQDTKRRIRRDELGPEYGELLETLARARLITLGAAPRTADLRGEDATVELTHEALITAWPRLHGWLAGDRDDLRTHRRLTEAVHTWRALDHDQGVLFRGAQLLLARDWADRAAGELTDPEKAFLTASVDAENAERETSSRRDRQLRRLSAGLVVSLVVVLGITVVAVGQRREAVDARQVAISRQLAVQAPTLSDSRPDTARLLGVEAYRAAPTAEARGALLSLSARGAYRTEFTAHDAPVSELAFSPDGRLLATASKDQTLALWDTRDHHRVARLTDHRAWLRTVAISHDDTLLASGGDDGDIVLWDLASRVRSATLTGPGGAVGNIAFGPRDDLLAAATAHGGVVLWDVTRQAEAAVLDTGGGPVSSVSFSPDGTQLAAGTDHGVEVWDVARHRRRALLEGASDQVRFSPDGRYLASAGGRTVRLWSTVPLMLVTELKGHTDDVRALAFSADGTTLASAGLDRTVRLWDVPLGLLRATLTGHTTSVYTVAFGLGSTLASAGERGSVIVWDTDRVSPTEPDPNGVDDLAFSPDGRTLAEPANRLITLWDTRTRTRRGQLREDSEVKAVAFSPDGKLLATGNADGTVTLWDPARQWFVSRLPRHHGEVLDIAFSPDGTTLVSAGADGTVQLWDVAHARLLPPLRGHDEPVNGVAFSPDGSTLATASHDATVVLWDTSGWKPRHRLTGHTGWVRAVAFSPDGALLASASADSTVRLWDARTGAPRETLTGHLDSEYNGVAFSPDSSTLAFTGGEYTISLWDVESGQTSARLSGHTRPVRAQAFSPDSSTLVTAGGDGDHAVLFWDTDADTTVRTICSGVGRELTAAEWKQFVPDLPRRPVCASGD